MPSLMVLNEPVTPLSLNSSTPFGFLGAFSESPKLSLTFALTSFFNSFLMYPSALTGPFLTASIVSQTWKKLLHC